MVEDSDDRVSLEGLDPEEALKALLAVKPGAEPSKKTQDDADDEPDPKSS